MENDESIENLGAEAGTGDSENALTLGDRYADRGEWTLAEEQYRRAVELGNLHALYRLGRALHEQRRLEEAEAVYREAIAEGDMGAAIALGNLFNERGNPDNFETAAKVSRSSPFVHDAFYVYRAEDE